MLNVTGPGSLTTCDGITRRDFLQVGTLGALGLTMADYSAAQAAGKVAGGSNEKSVIMIFNLGAPSQLDLFDMKPDAPSEIRGPFKAISTKGDFNSPRFSPATRRSPTTSPSCGRSITRRRRSTTPATR